jgi:hypothetical protein
MPHKGQRKTTNPKKKNSTKSDEEKAEIDTWEQDPLENQPVNGSRHSTDISGSTNNSSKLDDLSDSVYVRYKKSTLRFKEALQALVPSQIFKSDRVQVLMDASDYVSENGLSVDDGLLQDLKYTIRVRKRITCEKFEGGDSGHSYFISVLCYCWSVLAPLCPRKKKETPIESTRRSRKEEEENSSFHNRFASLAIGDADQGEEDNEDDLPQYSSKPSRPAEETHAMELTLHKMMSATELTDCALFLLTMEEYMEFNCKQYSMLKEKCQNNIGSKEPSQSDIVLDLIQISVGTNSTIQRVSSLEQRFNQDYPHLDSPYRFLAKLELNLCVQTISNIVHRLSSVSSRFKDEDAVMFVGDALECAFRSNNDPYNKSSHLVGRFCRHWKITDASEVDKVFRDVFYCAVIEAPLKQESSMIQDLTILLQDRGITNPNHIWLPFRFIGGKERSIIHTLRLLQHVPNVAALNGSFFMKPGQFGPTWDKTSKRPISTIPFEMDELLMVEIMPILINMCDDGILAKIEFPMKQELLSLFCHIMLFIKYPDRPVTWTLVFAIHSILSSIFESQGSKYLSYIADTASSAFNQYIQQMKWVKETVIPQAPRRPPTYEKKLQVALYLERLQLTPMYVNKVFTDDQMQRALWNPVCAGCILAFIAYFGNIEMGSHMIDASAQFRAWMHIYNALFQTGHVFQGEVPILDLLYEKFEKCKAVWHGPFPVRGQFVTRWWISFGMGVDSAQKCIASPTQKLLFSRAYRLRSLTPIEPQLFMKSYKRLCLREYADATDKYQTDEQSQDWERLSNTINAIEADKQLIAFNWATIGYYLNDAYLKLFEHLGLMTELDAFIEQMASDVRTGRTEIRKMNNRVVKSADSWLVSQENLKYQAMAQILARLFATLDKEGTVIMAVNVAIFMKNYFSHFPLNKIQWFDRAE